MNILRFDVDDDDDSGDGVDAEEKEVDMLKG